MINLSYNVHVLTFFKTGTISVILSAFENSKLKQSLTKMDDLARLSFKKEILYFYMQRGCWKNISRPDVLSLFIFFT